MATKRRTSVNDDNYTPKPKFNEKLPNQPKSRPASTRGKSKPIGGMKPDGGTPNGPKGGSKSGPRYKSADPNFPGYRKRMPNPQQKPRSQDPSQGPGRGKAVPSRPTSSSSRQRPSMLSVPQKKSKSNNKPGPWDDIARAAGAVKRTVYSNPTNRNKASNIDKWLKGGRYEQRPISSLPGDIATGAKALGKGLGKLAGAEKKVIKYGVNYATSPSKWLGTKAVKAGAKGAGKAASATANAAGNVAKNTAKGYSNIVKAEQKFVKAGAKTGVKAVKTGAKLLMKPVQPVKTQPMKKRSASSTSTKKK